MAIDDNRIRTYTTKLRRNKVLRKRVLQHLAIAINQHRLNQLMLDSDHNPETLYLETEKFGAFEASALSKLELAFRKPLRSRALWQEAARWFLTQHDHWQKTHEFQPEAAIPSLLTILPDPKRPGEDSWIEAQLLSHVAFRLARQLLEQRDWTLSSVEDLEILLGASPTAPPALPPVDPLAYTSNYPSLADQELSPWKIVAGDCFLEYSLQDDRPGSHQVEIVFGKVAWEMLQRLGPETTYLFLTLAALASEAATPWKGGFQAKASELIKRTNWERYENLTTDKKLKRIHSLIQLIGDLSISIIYKDIEKRNYIISNSKLLILEEFQFIGDLQTKIQDLDLDEKSIQIEKPDELTFRIRLGYWVKHLLNKQGQVDAEALRRYGYLAKSTLTINPYENSLAAKLSIFLTSMSQIQTNGRYQTKSLLETIESRELVNAVHRDPKYRDRLLEEWNDALLTLARLGWEIKFDSKTYPRSLQPSWSQTEGSPTHTQVRPRDWLSLWLNAQLTIIPTTLIQHRLEVSKTLSVTHQELDPSLNTNPHKGYTPQIIPGYALEMALAAKGITKTELAKQLQLDRSLVSHWIKGSRSIQPKHREQLWQLLGSELQQVTGIRG
ncbi:helix-turn-helix domain-containing protein [Leptodesmis sp.]|uniref:helix-turn-helix domain-containing protein n=1 Tax=Leptodesmis sp. TaxID=3100501 RepID=UPI0040534EE8